MEIEKMKAINKRINGSIRDKSKRCNRNNRKYES